MQLELGPFTPRRQVPELLTKMPPKKKVVCGSCSELFVGKQQFIICSGGCKRKFHCDCIKVGLEEYNVLMASGKSTYKCNDCTRRHRSAGDDKPNHGEETTDASGSDTDCESVRDTVNGPTRAYESESALQRMNAKLDVLTAEVKCLRADNHYLRSEVAELRKQLSQRVFDSKQPSQTYSTAASARQNPGARVTTNVTSSGGPSGEPSGGAVFVPTGPADVNRGSYRSRDVAKPSGGDLRQGGDPSAALDEGFTLVGPRRRNKPSVGKAKSSKVTVVPRPPAQKALFVSRLDPVTTAEDVASLVEPFLGGKPSCCTKMKTKYPYYSSFHVSVDQDMFEAINNPDIWPEGCIFHQFFGKLDSTRSFVPNNTDASRND